MIPAGSAAPARPGEVPLPSAPPPARPGLENIHRTHLPAGSRAGFLRLDMNESPEGLPPGFVREALAGIDEAALSMYPEYGELTRLVADSLGTVPDRICLANGSDAAIKHLFEAYVAPGDSVLLTDPTFAMYPVYCGLFSARVETVAYAEDLSFPVDRFLDALDGGHRLAVLVNPNNPTGTALPLAAIEAAAERCDRAGTLLVVDEAYFHYHGETAAGLLDGHPCLVVLRTFSKLCGLASLRLGFAAAHPEVVENLRRVKPTFDVNGVAVRLAERLLARPAIVHELMAGVERGKAFLTERLREAGLEHRIGRANFALIRCPGRPGRAGAIASALAARKILVSHGFAHPGLRDCIRVSLADVPVMERFWNAFREVAPVAAGAEMADGPALRPA